MIHRFSTPLLVSLLASLAWGADFVPATGDWNTASNWNPVGVPTATTTVNIPSGTSATISADAVAASVTVGGTLVLASGSLEIPAAAAVTVTGQLSVTGSGVSLRPDNPADGTILPCSLTIASGGTLAVASNATLGLDQGVTLTNNGSLSLASRGRIQFDGNTSSSFTTTGSIAWTMSDGGLGAIQSPTTVTLGGSLTSSLASDFFPEVDDIANLILGIGAGGKIGSFATATTTDFTDNSGTSTVAFKCVTSHLVTPTVTINSTSIIGPFIYGDTFTPTGTTTATGATLSWETADTTPLISVVGTTATCIKAGSGATIAAKSPKTGSFRQNSATATIGTINPKAITVTVDGGTRAFGSATNPTPTFTVSGLVNGDTAASLGTPTYSGSGTTADATTAIGTYPVTVTGLSNPNYTITVVDGTLTITAVSHYPGTASSSGGGGGCGLGGGMGVVLGCLGLWALRRRA